MSFIRSREVVDKETKETYRSYQLVETHWQDGQSKQKVVANLGEHPTIEDAAAELRERLRELEAKRDEHREEASRYASDIKETYSAQLNKFHGGRIPTKSAHHRWAWPKPWATERGKRYMREFGRVEWKRSSLRQGQTYEAYSGYETFGSWVHMYWWHEKQAAGLQARVDKLSGKLGEFERLSSSKQTGNP